MSIREPFNTGYTDDARKCATDIRVALECIFNTYGTQFSNEELFWMVSSEAQDIVNIRIIESVIKQNKSKSED